MSSLDPTEMIVLTAVVATGSGFLAARTIHARLCAAREGLFALDALLELADRLRPLADELDRRLAGCSAGEPWREPTGGTTARLRLRGADPLVFMTHDLESLWRAKLEMRIASAPVHSAYEEFRGSAGAFSRLSLANRRPAAEELFTRVQDLLATTAAPRREYRPRAFALTRRSAGSETTRACSDGVAAED
jgi:hypothetical protein